VVFINDFINYSIALICLCLLLPGVGTPGTKRERAELGAPGRDNHLYEDLLRSQYPDRLLYLAIRDTVYESFFQEEFVQIVLESRRLKLLIFDEIHEVIIQWIPEMF